MCAAPGSKVCPPAKGSHWFTHENDQTAQILEALHANDTSTSTSFPPGLLIANDSDHKRTQLLIHQSARLPSPALMVTNLDASIYPTLRIPASGTSQKGVLLFDRILCDVPCSGDGTLRKNPGIWKSWQIGDGNGLHGCVSQVIVSTPLFVRLIRYKSR
jgi:multisite-specific tRNA:(cytosine-C5)-methyltransferase